MRASRFTSTMKVAAIVALIAILPSPILFLASQVTSGATTTPVSSKNPTASDRVRGKEERDRRLARQKEEAQKRLDKIMARHEANRRPMELTAPYWKEGDGFVSTLAVNNTFTRSIEITPVVRRADGQELQARAFTVAAHQSLDLALSDLVRGISGYGQIALRYTGEPLEVNAMVAITNPKQSLSVDYVLADRAGITSSELHGVFYVPTTSTRSELVLSNASDQPLAATIAVVVEDAAASTSREVSIDPYKTTIVDLQADLRPSAGRRPISARVSLKHTGAPGDLLAHGTLMAPNGFSANMRILEASGLYGETLYSPVLPLSEAVQPVAVLGNTKDRSVNLRIEASYTLDKEVLRTTLRTVSIAAQGVLHVDLDRDVKALPTGAHSIGLTFHHYAEGGILTDLLLIDGSGSGVYQVSPKGYSAHQHTSHNFPFRLDGGLNTILTLANPSKTDEMEYVLHLFYEGKNYTHKETKLKPGETRYVNIRDLRDNQVPGQLKEVMPRSVVTGQAVVHFRPKEGSSSTQSATEHAGHYSTDPVGIAGGTTYDAQGKMSFTTCPPQCPPEFYNGEVDNGYIEGIVGDEWQIFVIVYDSSGSYQLTGNMTWTFTGYPVTDASGDRVYMLEEGYTTLSANVDLWDYYCSSCGCGDSWPWFEIYVDAYVNPYPDVSIDGFDDSEEAETSTFDVTLTGGIPGIPYQLTIEATREGQGPVTIFSGTRTQGTHTLSYSAQGSSLPNGTYTALLAQWGPSPQRMLPYMPYHDGCDDGRSDAILEYWIMRKNYIPRCEDFTNSRSSSNFTFSDLNTGDFAWALVRDPFVAAASSGHGLDRWIQELGSTRNVNSAYRNPRKQARVGQALESRHMYGDAADLDVVSDSLAEWTLLAEAADRADADFIEPTTLQCSTNCTHADWRNHAGDYQP